MACSLDVVPTLWASYAISGHMGLSDGVQLKNDNGFSNTNCVKR